MSSTDTSRDIMTRSKSLSTSNSPDTITGDEPETQNTFDDVFERIDEYYKLKRKYESTLSDKKNNILKNDELNMKQKRDKFEKLKIRCINCEKPVNTIFSINDGVLSAICGSKTNPCNLNIKLNRGKFIDIRELISVFQNSVDDIKDSIISTKLDLLFGFNTEDETLVKFKELKGELTNDLETLAQDKVKYINIVGNLNNKPLLSSNMTIFYQLVSTIKNSIKEYNESGNINLIKDVISLYQKDLKPILEKISSLTYKERSVEVDTDNNKFYLHRKPYLLSDLLVPFSNPEIESFEIGRVSTSSTTGKKVIQEDIEVEMDDEDISSPNTSPSPSIDKLTIKDGIIKFGDKVIANKTEYKKNVELQTELQKVTIVEANAKKYQLEMLYVDPNKPVLFAIDTTTGQLYMVEI